MFYIKGPSVCLYKSWWVLCIQKKKLALRPKAKCSSMPIVNKNGTRIGCG